MDWQKILYWGLVLFIVYIIIEVLRKIFWGSLGFEELTITLLVANLGYSSYLMRELSRVNSKISMHLGWHNGKVSRKK